MRKGIVVLAAALVAGGAVDSFALFGKAETKTESGNATNNLGTYKGIKKEVGVKGFENQAGWSGDYDLAQNLGVMLESSLFDTGRFVVLQREKLQDVIAEQDLQASGRAAKAKNVAQTGKLRSARYIAGGAITEVSHDQSGGGGGVNIGGFRLGLSKNEAQIAVVVTLTDTTTGEIVGKERVIGKAGGTGVNVGYSGSIGGDLGGFRKTPIGQAAQDVVNKAAEFLAKKMEEFPLQGAVVKVGESGQVIINRGSEFGVEVGQALVMATEGQELTDPDTGASLGREEGKTIGKLKVSKTLEKVSYCEVTEGEKNPEAGTVVTFNKK